ncbi:hypothetical protein OG568_50750 (plasmid) [Streptomyces sp. NBC_01450]|uniref:hypothetical protein n=1 Tax=Streptomyces sp. NBC_01450 TaxID=2903871 RepID=UPI002E33C0A8|nr:hypothetical protein [Streptomyces sp. NBC_01450]
MLIVACGVTVAAGSFRQRSSVGLVFLHRRDVLIRLVAGFGVAVGTAHLYATAVIRLLH